MKEILKNYPWKEFACLALTPLVILLFSGIGILIVKTVSMTSPISMLGPVFIIITILGFSIVKYLHFYLLVIGIIPLLFAIDKVIYKIFVVFLVNLIFFYLIANSIDKGTSWDLSKLVTGYTILASIVYTFTYTIIRLIAGKIKKKTLETEPPVD